MALVYSDLAARYGLACQGLIHAGAHVGQEYADYKRAGVERLVFFEPQPHIFRELTRRLGGRSDVTLIDQALGAAPGRIPFYVERDNQGMSSSALPPAPAMARQYPGIHLLEQIDVQQVTLDDYLASAPVPAAFEALVLDVQGYELAVLHGSKRLLARLTHIVTEVSRVSLYQGGALVQEIDNFLKAWDFHRVETSWDGGGWGDALYLRSPVGPAAWRALRVSPTCQIPNLGSKFAELFGPYHPGVFVEIGAFDGESYSNTSGLADNGWQGTYVEPIPEYAARCRQRHRGNQVEVVVAAVGQNDGEIDIGVAGEYSSASRPNLESVAPLHQYLDWSNATDRPDTIRWYTAPQISLDRLLSERQRMPGFDLLVVDTEGGEWDALHAFPWAKWLPQVAIVDLARPGNLFATPETLARSEDLTKRIVENGYEVYWCDPINTIFRRRH
jgi:FkbM family methyltransferase